MSDSIKIQAEEIISAINADLVKTGTDAVSGGKVNALFDRLMNSINDVDMDAAARRVNELRAKYPKATDAELSKKLIKQKVKKTASVGIVTSGAGLIPGIGTATALILGTAADIGATFKLHAELVLEISYLYQHQLSEQEKQQVVLLITGISAGASSLARKAGQRASIKFSETFAEKSILKALPVLGVIASAGTNVLSTHVIGQRADAYFRLGPEGVQSWQDSLRAVTGLDERRIIRWANEGRQNAGNLLGSGVEAVRDVGQSTGTAIATGALQVADGGKKAGRFYFKWLKIFWRVVFQTLAGILQLFLQPFRAIKRIKLRKPKKS